MNFGILGAILRKDARSLMPLVLLIALLFLADGFIARLDLLPVWSEFNTTVVLAAVAVLILAVFQLDSPASLTDDWLCRPLRKRELLAAKFILVLVTVYLPRAIGIFVADLSLGFSVTESFLDAVLLQDKVLLFALPVLLFTAIITRTLVAGFGVLLAILIGVFVVPTPFVRPPGPLSPGINEQLFFLGLQWLSTTPAKLAALILVAIGFWLVYWRHRLAAARLLLAITVCVMLFLVVLPMALIPWNSTFAIQTAFSAAPTADVSRISLRNPRACFPAARRAELSTDTDFDAAIRLNDLRLWADEDLPDVGPDSVAFLTAIETRGLPLDWRAQPSYVQANYLAGDKVLYSLRPAQYFVSRTGGGSLAHIWMLPEPAVQRLSAAQPQFELTYSMTLLKPHEYGLPTDGKRHALPELGYCSARVDESGNRIEVDCFTAFAPSAQISAELNEIPASRVYGSMDLAPAYVRWPYSRRVKLTIGSPRLAKHDSITVTSWEAAGTLQKSLRTPGILGAGTEICPLPAENERFRASRWRDAAPHEAQSITVDAGVQLEVLDFGGTGSAVVLLPGLGATAHSFDELAPLLAQKHRVVAMTRRGTGYSSKPDFGFDTPRLAQDVLQVMDAMGLGKVTLVGHSIAGDELTWLGGKHPDRFSGLVYLDAAYDRSGNPRSADALRLRELGRRLPPEPPYPPEALVNFDALTKLLLERGHVRMPEGELIAFNRMNDPYLAGTPNIDGRTQQAIIAAIQAPNYAAVKIPALAIYAFESSSKPLPPWYDPNDSELRSILAERARINDGFKRASIDLFKREVESGQVLEMQNASHYIFQSNPREVLDAIEKFVGG